MEDIIELYDLIEYEKECLRNWKTKQDLSLMPTGWSIRLQEEYMDHLYEEFYQITTTVFDKELTNN
jgi:hypothetical protein